MSSSNNTRLMKMLSAIPLAFWPGFKRSAQGAWPGSQQPTKNFREPGHHQPADTKLGRMAEEHRLDGTNQDSVVSRAFRNEKINRNLARFANEVRDNNEPEPLPAAVVHQRVQGW